MTRTIDLPLTEPQEVFAFHPEPFPAIVGGLGSGKTQAGVSRLIIRMLTHKKRVAYYMPTYDLLKLRAIPEFVKVFAELGIKTSLNKSDYELKVKGYGSVIFRSYDNPDRIVAYEVADSIVDELDTLKKEDAAKVWRKITERNRQRSPLGNTIGCVTTPDQGIHGFIYQKWVKLAAQGYAIIKAPTYSNPYLDDDYIPNIRANYDPLMAEMYIEGEFVSLNDKKVYHFFSRDRHHSDRTIQQGERLCVSIDFNIGGCCATAWVIDSNMPIAVDEFVSHDTQDFINNLASRYRGHKLTIYPDASGGANRTNAAASDIELIKNAGYAVDAPDSNPLVRDRINAYNALFAHDRIKVNTNKCPELTNALEVQGYTDKGEPEKFNEHPAVDDWVDSSGYFINRRFSVKAPMATGVKFGR
jgi:phage terminase large subunit